jgi:hypothetical protein
VIAHLIRWSVRNRFFVMIGVLTLIGVGVWAVRSTAIDALPDLSDTQVIIRTSYPGRRRRSSRTKSPIRSPPHALVPGAKTVRGYSFFGDSFVYVIFEDGTDLYGRAAACSNISTRYKAGCRPAPAARWGRMRPGWAGSMNMRWSIALAATISRSFAGFRTGSCATS